jgi:hypothetical protein
MCSKCPERAGFDLHPHVVFCEIRMLRESGTSVTAAGEFARDWPRSGRAVERLTVDTHAFIRPFTLHSRRASRLPRGEKSTDGSLNLDSRLRRTHTRHTANEIHDEGGCVFR